MMFKKSIENVVYLSLYIIALLLFFLCGGNAENSLVLLGSAHVLCVAAVFISSDKDVTAFLLRSFSVYTLIANILFLSGYSKAWFVASFFIIGLLHVLILEDDDLFGVLAKNNKEHEMYGLKMALWLMISVMVTVFYVFA